MISPYREKTKSQTALPPSSYGKCLEQTGTYWERIGEQLKNLGNSLRTSWGTFWETDWNIFRT